jgi:hypothetical protein
MTIKQVRTLGSNKSLYLYRFIYSINSTILFQQNFHHIFHYAGKVPSIAVLLTWRLTSIVVCDDILLHDFWLFDWLTHNNNISSCTNLIMSAFFHITIYFLTTCPSKKWLDLNLPPVITMYRQVVLYYYWMLIFLPNYYPIQIYILRFLKQHYTYFLTSKRPIENVWTDVFPIIQLK